MLNRIRFVLWTIVLTLVVVLAIPTLFHQRAVLREGHGEILTILHTNDHHGHPLATEGEGGLPQRATLIKQKRAELPNLLLLDAGDINAGMPISNMNKAEPDILAYNQLGYDAMAIGNHEFDKGLPLLETQMKQAKFPWLCANLKRKSDGALLAKPYIVKDFKNFRVGIFGLSVQAECNDVIYENAVDVARQMVSELRDKEHVQLVIALAHLGIQKDISVQTTSVQLAEEVSGIDLIVDGHAHTLMNEPLVVNGTPIVSAFEFGKRLGEATFEIVNGKPYLLAWQSIPITDKIPADPEMTALLQPYIERTGQILNEPLGTATAPFGIGMREPRSKETCLSDFICDSVLKTARKHGLEADFLFITGGCIRASWPQGTITYQHVAATLPFDDPLYLVTLDGKQLAEFFEFIGRVPSGAGGFAQFSSEVRYTLHRNADDTVGNGTISDITIQGQPIDPNRKYTILTSTYLANGGDHYDILKNAPDKQKTDLFICGAMVEYLRANQQPLVPQTDGRIQIVPVEVGK